jgi:hypothetical protein
MLDYSKIPVPYMVEGMRYYMERAPVMHGDFLIALLSNDLMEAFGRADDTNRAAMFEWCRWLYNEAPLGSYGSKEAVRQWLEAEKADA